MLPAIRVHNLGKLYKIGAKKRARSGSLLETIAQTLSGPFSSSPRPLGKTRRDEGQNGKGERGIGKSVKDNTIWALKDVSFEVQPGEVCGIIGRNGAGKSTLLKILSRITEPTEGHVEINGRVASLLEVGTGFHPELTGGENIYLNGAVLGMSKAEVDRKFDEIVGFAEIEKFVDTPVKRYSSGMYMRLAFTVAAHLEPEILIVDEVLAVGDASFQKKCLGKMKDIAHHGRTILFVSHNMQAIRNFCPRVIWLDNGKAVAEGAAEAIIYSYIKNTADFESLENTSNLIALFPPDPAFKLRSVTIIQDGCPTTTVVNSKPVEIEIKYDVYLETPGLHLYFLVYDFEGTLLFESLHNGDEENIPTVFPGAYTSTAIIPADFLAGVTYRVCVNAGISNIRAVIPEPVQFNLNVHASGRVNRAYAGYMTTGRLAPWFEWRTTLS